MGKATTLVLLPGLDGTEILLAPLLAALPPSLRPLVITYPPSGDNSYAGLLALARRAIADVPECHVLGWSFAGPLALMLAAAEPVRVRSVILTASFVRRPTPLLALLGFALAAPPVWLWRAARRLPLWLLRPRSDPLRRAKSETWKRVSARVIAARLRAVAASDAGALLRACRQPVLYLASSADGIVPLRNAAEILRLRPSVRLVTIEGPHLAMFTNPQAAARAIGRFVASCHQAVTVDQEYRAALS
jgi:pimeloyl-[acyl-carrier protein] methyl ester esterase